MAASGKAQSRPRPRSAWMERARSSIRHGIGLRTKLVVLVLTITITVVGALFCFSWSSLRSSISAIYESRARTVATIISRSIQEKEYILYYSDALDREIDGLLTRYPSVIGITVIGRSARGFLAVSSTDPTRVGQLVDEETQLRYEALGAVEVEQISGQERPFLRALHPILSQSELAGLVIVEMSLDERIAYIARLSIQFGSAALAGIVLLGGLLHLALRSIVTKPIASVARSIEQISQRNFGTQIALSPPRAPGTPQRDEISRLVDGHNLMSRFLEAHEQELRKLVVLDELTGAYTKNHFRSELERELLKTKRYRHPTSVLVVHAEGLRQLPPEQADALLVRTAAFLVRNLRSVDVLFRIAEDRFAVLLPSTPLEGAVVAASRLREQIADLLQEKKDALTIHIVATGWEEESVPPLDTAMDMLLHDLSE